MTEKKTSFVLPTDLLSELEDFSDDEVGKIFRAVLNYTSINASRPPNALLRPKKSSFDRITDSFHRTV